MQQGLVLVQNDVGFSVHGQMLSCLLSFHSIDGHCGNSCFLVQSVRMRIIVL